MASAEHIPAELPGMVHAGSSLDVALVWVIDGGGPCIGSTQNEDEAVEGNSWGVLIICTQQEG